MASKTGTALPNILKDLCFRFKDDDVPALAAQLTYYFILSFFPFLIFLITLISYTPITNEQALNNLSRILPEEAYIIINDVINQAVASDRGTLISLGMFTTIWASSNGMNAVIRGINKAYDQKETRAFWKVRAISIASTFALAITIIFSFILLVLGKVLGEQLFQYLGYPDFFISLWTLIRFLIPVFNMLVVFSIIYCFIPNRRLKLKEVLPGSMFTTVGWFLTSGVFSFYINNLGNFSRTYDSVGGIFVLMIWLYWISIIVLLGGEINASLVFLRYKP
ncbi:MAG: YihY/virulence factor BrkB family protein [Clostridiaceae bacterium]|nr:YihY/virulence factor BrkB family protein [Clostridiaceae bacterium]